MEDLHYSALAEFIAEQNSWVQPAELDGLLAVYAALNRPAQEALPLLFGAQISEPARSLGQMLWQRSHERLHGEALSYQPILPEAPLSARAEALLSWIEGFQNGLRACRHRLDAQQHELFHHLRALQDLDCAAIVNDEEHRRLLNILEEHARLCLFSLL